MSNRAPLSIRMFGRFEVRLDGALIPPTRTRTERLLLALLTLQKGGMLGRDSAGALLWPDSTSSQRLANLRRSLVNLRDVLGPEAERLSSGAGELRFDLTGAYVDVLEFDRLAGATDPERLRRAIALYRGALLTEWECEWAVAERLERVTACVSAIRRLLPSIAPADAIQYLRQAVVIDPVGESSLRDLMSLLAKSGDVKGALDAYRSHELKVKRQFGWGMSPETTSLFDRLQTAVRPSPVADSQVAVRPRLIGRQAELNLLQSAFQAARLVTITGPPGVGKSRLASEFADSVRAGYRDGCWHVPMRSGEPFMKSLCGVWSLDLAGGADSAVRTFLAGREVLLVIDGVEFVSDEFRDELTLVQQIGPGIHCLLTSWQATELPGERHLALEPLATSESTSLFEDCARRSSPGFALSAANLQEVEPLCRDLEGLPLAIEIAAAWTSTLTITHIRELFAGFESFDEALEQASPGRPRSLRAALEGAIGGLAPDELDTLCAIAAFPDGCGMDAIRFVANLEFTTVAQCLQRLVSRSLVAFDSSQGRYRMLKVIRDYCLVRLHPEERERWASRAGDYLWGLVVRGLADGDTLFDDYSDRWLLAERENYRFFVDWWRPRDLGRSVVSEFAMVAYQVWQPPDVRTWLARFAAPADFPQGPEGFREGAEPFIRYMIGIFALWQRHPDRRELLEIALATAKERNTPLWEAASFTGLSVLAQEDGDYAETARYEAEVQRAARSAGLAYYPEHSQAIQSAFEYLGGDEGGRTRLWDQLQRGNLAGDWRIRYASLRGLAFVALRERDYASLFSWSRELVSIGEEHCPHELTHILRWQISAAIECGDLVSAREWAEWSIEIARERRSHDREATARLLLAEIAERRQEQGEAERQLVVAGQIYESISDYRQFSICLIRRAGFAESRNQKAEFIRLVRWAKALSDAKGFVLGEPHAGTLREMLERA